MIGNIQIEYNALVLYFKYMELTSLRNLSLSQFKERCFLNQLHLNYSVYNELLTDFNYIFVFL